MRTILLITIAALTGLTLVAARSARCTDCGVPMCTSSSACYAGCACAKAFDQPYGTCVPVQ